MDKTEGGDDVAAVVVQRIHRAESDEIGSLLGAWLPEALLREIGEVSRGMGRIEELRLRRGRYAALTDSAGTRLLSYITAPHIMDELVEELCGGSLYAHRETISEGYLTLSGGIRVGICGRAAVENGRLTGVYDVSSLNFRFPKHIRNLGAPICRLIGEEGIGVLIYAPPGVGKTTLLRSVCEKLAGREYMRRVAVVDTRGELGFGMTDPALTLDILTGYPRALGVEIAARTMNAQLIVCDEIGERAEAEAILAVQNCGVPFLATAHGSTAEGVLRRSGLRLLHEARVFGAYVGIRRKNGGFEYTVTKWEDVDGMVQADGGISGRS